MTPGTRQCTNFKVVAHRNVTPEPGPGFRPLPPGAHQGTARSPSGSIAVATTERGLPTALKIDPRELKKSPQQLANEILALCRLSAMRAQVAHRRALIDEGRSPELISDMKLASEDDLVKAEEELRGDDDQLPSTWMRSV